MLETGIEHRTPTSDMEAVDEPGARKPVAELLTIMSNASDMVAVGQNPVTLVDHRSPRRDVNPPAPAFGPTELPCDADGDATSHHRATTGSSFQLPP